MCLQDVLDIMAPMVAKGNMRVEPVFDVSWGGTSMLNAELAMAEALLEMGDWDYWINLSSTDYPLKPLDELRKWLAQPKVPFLVWSRPEPGPLDTFETGRKFVE